jgi:hypothetical protein
MPHLKIHFTGADLGRTRLAPRIDHMWEIVSAVHLLQHREGGLCFDGWRREVRQQALADPRLRGLVDTLVHIAPHAEYFPDFLTPAGEYDNLGDALDAVVSMPKTRLRAEMTLLGDVPASLRAVADGGLPLSADCVPRWGSSTRRPSGRAWTWSRPPCVPTSPIGCTRICTRVSKRC